MLWFLNTNKDESAKYYFDGLGCGFCIEEPFAKLYEFCFEISPIMKTSIEFLLNSFSGLSTPVWLLSLVMLINRTGAMVLPFLTIYLTEELQFSMYQAGIVMAFFGLGAVAGSFIGGLLTDRIGYYKVQVASLFLSGVCWLGMMYIQSFEGLCLYVFFLTTIADTFRPANMAAIAAFSTPENRARSISLMRLAINLGFGLGPGLGGILAKGFGYHWLFIIDGTTCILAGFLMLWQLQPRKREHQKPPELEDSSIVNSSPFKDKIFLKFLFLQFITAFTFFQLLSTLPHFLKNGISLEEDVVGYIMSFNGILIFLIEMPIVYAFEKAKNLLRLCALGVLAIGTSYLVFNAFSWGLSVALLSMVFLTVGEIFALPFANTFALNRSNTLNRGKYMSVYTATFSVALILSSPVGMFISEQYGYYANWWVMGVLSIIAGIGFLVLGGHLSKKTSMAL